MDAINLQGIFALDSAYQNVNGWSHDDNVWNIYWTMIQPAIYQLWMGILAILGIIWYLVTKDKSESLAIFLVPAIWISFGVQDLIYFVFSPQTIMEVGCWADVMFSIRIISDLLRETCPTVTSFALSAILGLGLSWFVLYKLKYLEWRKKK